MRTVASATPDFREIFKERYQMIVQAVDICKRFDATVALDHAKIELVPGQIHSIVGENGAGKSTLLKRPLPRIPGGGEGGGVVFGSNGCQNGVH